MSNKDIDLKRGEDGESPFVPLKLLVFPFPWVKVDPFPLNFPSSLLPTPNFSALTFTLPNSCLAFLSNSLVVNFLLQVVNMKKMF